MNRKKITNILMLTLIATTSTQAITYANTLSNLENKSQLEIEKNNSISEQLSNLEKKYGVKIDLNEEINQEDIYFIEDSIKNTLKSIDELRTELSVPKKIEFNSLERASQEYSGTTYVEALIPAIGLYNVYIPYNYTIVQAGGNPPYFSNASAGVSYGGGISIGTYSHQESWAEITSRDGRQNNVLELRAKGTIVYSVGKVNISLPNQVFLKTFYL